MLYASLASFSTEVIVAALIVQLGDTNYIKREKASAALLPFAHASTIQLELAFKNPDAEIAHRAWLLYRTGLDHVAFTFRAVFPWLLLEVGEFGYDETFIYMRLARERWSSDYVRPTYYLLRDATKFWVLDQLRSRVPTTEINRRLNLLEERSKKWQSIDVD